MATRTADIRGLEALAKGLRITDMEMLIEAGSGHPGGTLSIAEMVSVLFFHTLRLKPDEPDWEGRDRFILSKGHCIPIVYAAMAKLGFFPEEELMTLRKMGSRLQGHPDRRMLPGIEASTGSLGQGLSVAVGMAVAGRLDRADRRVYCLMGDGEQQSGHIWEAAMLAPALGLDNLCAILDQNQVQQTGKVAERLPIEPIGEKWDAFGWNVLEIDGHSIAEIAAALDAADAYDDGPTIIVSHTIKGKGVSFMELSSSWHGKAPSGEDAERALAELRGAS